MKQSFLLSAVIISLLLGCTHSSNNAEQKTTATQSTLDTTKLKTGDVYYQCEMHPEVLSLKDTACYKCGMDLTKMVKK